VTVLAQSVGQLQDTWVAMQRFLPRLLAFLVVLVVGYVVARLLARAVAAMLARTGFEHAVQRGGVGQVLARSGYDAGTLLSKVVFFGLLLLVLQLAFAVFGPNPVSASLAGVIAFLPRLFVAMVIVVLAAAIAAGARELVVAQIGELSYGHLLAGSAYALILGIGVFAALDQLQIAPAIVNGLFYGLITIIVGVTIVAVGGGGIAPMRQRWEQALTRMDTEAVRMREAAQHQREQRAAAEERERQARVALEEQQRQRDEQEHVVTREREAAERDELERQEREAAEVHARRAREEQERRTAREFEALAQQGVYTEEQLRAARELAEFEQQHASDGQAEPGFERLDVYTGDRRRSTREPAQHDNDDLQRHAPQAEGNGPEHDDFTGDQRQAAWELEAFRQEEVAVEQQRQARERDTARTQDFNFFERDVEFLQPSHRPPLHDEDAAAQQPDNAAGLEYRRRPRTARRSPAEQERPPIRYWDTESQPAQRRHDPPNDERTGSDDVEPTRPIERTPWDAPDR
jgi:hypothetical protein